MWLAYHFLGILKLYNNLIVYYCICVFVIVYMKWLIAGPEAIKGPILFIMYFLLGFRLFIIHHFYIFKLFMEHTISEKDYSDNQKQLIYGPLKSTAIT